MAAALEAKRLRLECDEVRLDAAAWEAVARAYTDDTTRKFEQARAVLARVNKAPG